MCSYEKPGRPGYRDLGFCDWDLGNRDKIFSYEHSGPGNREEIFFIQNSVAFATKRPKKHNFCLVCISTLGACELAWLLKLKSPQSCDSRERLTIQVYVPPFWLCFSDFIAVDRAACGHPGNRASLVTKLKWRGPRTKKTETFRGVEGGGGGGLRKNDYVYFLKLHI